MNMLLKGALTLAAGAIWATASLADGMPRGGSIKDAPVAPTCGTSAYNWNGGFAGLQLGTANYRSAVTIEDILNIASQREETGFTIGGVLGYNWQKCNTVLGIEGEFSWTDVDRKWGITIPGLGIPANLFNASSSMDWYAAIKGRTGFAFDNLLLYLTGGFAFASIEHKGSNPAIGGVIPAGIVSFSNSETRFGWVVGAGTEYALSSRMTWRTEATYTRFQDQDFNLNIAIPGAPAIKLNAQDEVWLIRTGLNFKF